jgi:hypothetical protein
MNAWVLALLPAVIGVDYGWERKPDGSIVYIIQVEPEAVESMKTGAELVGALPPELRNITNYKIRLGRDLLPNHNKLPPEISNRSAAAPPSAFPGAGTTQPLSGAQPLGGTQPGTAGFNATSNYQTQPNYTNQPSYTNQPNYVGAPTGSMAGGTGGQPTSTSGFPIGGSNPAYNPGVPMAGGSGFVNNNTPGNGLNYNNTTTPNYNPAAPGYQPQSNPQIPAGYVFNPATGTYGPPPTLPTGAIAPTGSTSTAGWTMSNGNGATPTYGAGAQPNYGVPPALGPTAGQPANWASNPNSNYYGAPANSIPTGPVFPGNPTPDYQSVGRPGLDSTQPGGFVNNGATNGGVTNSGMMNGGMTNAGANNGQVPPQNRAPEPASVANGTTTNPPAPAEQEKSMGLMWVLVGLFASLAFNLWCGWNLYNIRERYRSLLSERAPAY